MKGAALGGFFTGRRDQCERIVAALQYITTSVSLSGSLLSEDDLAVVLEKGLLYRGMLPGFNDLNLRDQVQKIADSFSEYEDFIVVGSSVDLAMPLVGAGAEASVREAVMQATGLILSAFQRDACSSSSEGETDLVAMFCSCGDKLYVLNVSVSRFLNGHEAQVTNSGEEIFGAILQISSDAELQPMSGTSISSWVQALLAEVRSQKEGEGAVECPLMRLSIVVGVKRDRLNELSTVDLPAGQLLKRISREVASLRRYFKEESILTVRKVLLLPPPTASREFAASPSRQDTVSTIGDSPVYDPAVYVPTPRATSEAVEEAVQRSHAAAGIAALPSALMLSVDEDIAAFSARAYQFMRNAALEGCIMDSIDVAGGRDEGESLADSDGNAGDSDADGLEAIEHRSEMETESHCEDLPRPPSELDISATRLAQTQTQTHFQPPPATAPTLLQSRSEHFGKRSEKERRSVSSSLLASAGRRSFDLPIEPLPDIRLGSYVPRALSPEHRVVVDDAMDFVVDATEEGRSSPLSSSLLAFMNNTNASPTKPSEQIRNFEIDDTLRNIASDHAEAARDEQCGAEESDVSAANLSSLVAADIDRLLGLTSSPGGGSEDDADDHCPSVPGGIEEDAEMDRWMNRDIDRSVDKRSRGQTVAAAGIPGGTMRRLEKWMDIEQLEVSLDSNSSDDEFDGKRATVGSYDSKLVPAETDLIDSMDVAAATRLQKEIHQDGYSSEDSRAGELRDSFTRAHLSQEVYSNSSEEDSAEDQTIDKNIYVLEKPPSSTAKPLLSHVNAPSLKPLSTVVNNVFLSSLTKETSQKSLPSRISASAEAAEMDSQLKARLLEISTQLEATTRHTENERTRRRRELGFLCLTQLYQNKENPKFNAQQRELPPVQVHILPPAISIDVEQAATHRPAPDDIKTPHSVRTVSTAASSVMTKRSVRTGAIIGVQPAGSPGANSRASQFSGAIGVTQLRELMDNDEDDAVSHSQSHASDYSHLSRGLPTKAKYKDKMSNNPRAAMVDYSLSPSSTSPADHASKRVAKVEPRPPSPPNVIVEIDRMVSARQAVEKRGVGLIFIDAKKPTPIEVPKVSEERAPVRAQAAMIVDVASSEDQLLLQEQKRIQRKMQQKVSSLEQRNRERSRSRGRGYGMRGGTAIEEDGVKPAPIDSIVDPLTDNAPSGYEDRAVRRQKPLEVHGVDDSRSMFSADAPSAVTRRGRITAITAHRPEDSGLPDLPAAVAGSRGPKRNAAVMDDEAMRRLEKEVDMINELIGLTSNPKPAVSEEPVAIVESASRAKSRPASVGRAGSAGRPRREIDRGQATTLSNIQQIRNAIQYVCLAGGADSTIREQVLSVINTENDEHLRRREQQQNEVEDKSLLDYDPFHLVLLLQDNSLGFKGVYRYRQSTGVLSRLCGKQGCPKIIDSSCVGAFYKYETSSRSFKQQHTTTHINNTTDALCLDMVKVRRLQSR